MTDAPQIQAVIGLGNPGEKYHRTRHNIGFRVLETLAGQSGRPFSSPYPPGWFSRVFRLRRKAAPSTSQWNPIGGGAGCRIEIGGRRIILFRPDQYMNRSGEAIETFLEETGSSLSRSLIVVDDIDLPLGRLRLKASGGPGSHNGLRNICKVLGSSFPRLRFGIRGEESWEDLADYVLSNFSPEEESRLEERIVEACRMIRLAITEGLEGAMNIANRKKT